MGGRGPAVLQVPLPPPTQNTDSRHMVRVAAIYVHGKVVVVLCITQTCSLAFMKSHGFLPSSCPVCNTCRHPGRARASTPLSSAPSPQGYSCPDASHEVVTRLHRSLLSSNTNQYHKRTASHLIKNEHPPPSESCSFMPNLARGFCSD
jgi:hypothetical protein